MGDSMPKPKNLSRECEHKWEDVIITEKKTVVEEADVILDRTDVYFCSECNSVLENL